MPLEKLTFNDPTFVQLASTTAEHWQGTHVIVATRHFGNIRERRLGLWLGEPTVAYLAGPGQPPGLHEAVSGEQLTALAHETVTLATANGRRSVELHTVKTEGWMLSLALVAGQVPGTTFQATMTLAAGERIVRYTHPSVDPRFTGGVLAAKAYFTSENDAVGAPNGFAAVGRYAIPSPLPAWHRHVYELTAPVTVVLGTARPAFGQAGGGSEGQLTAAAAVTLVPGHPLPLPIF